MDPSVVIEILKILGIPALTGLVITHLGKRNDEKTVDHIFEKIEKFQNESDNDSEFGKKIEKLKALHLERQSELLKRSLAKQVIPAKYFGVSRLIAVSLFAVALVIGLIGFAEMAVLPSQIPSDLSFWAKLVKVIPVVGMLILTSIFIGIGFVFWDRVSNARRIFASSIELVEDSSQIPSLVKKTNTLDSFQRWYQSAKHK